MPDGLEARRWMCWKTSLACRPGCCGPMSFSRLTSLFLPMPRCASCVARRARRSSGCCAESGLGKHAMSRNRGLRLDPNQVRSTLELYTRCSTHDGCSSRPGCPSRDGLARVWRRACLPGPGAAPGVRARARTAAEPLDVRVDGGTVRGGVERGVIAFKGIPYAAPPVGVLRWAPPQPVKPWTGVRPARHFAPDCEQLPWPGDAAPLRVAFKEDCLYINVWRPRARSARGLPVMVWIYGGGFVDGGTSPAVYDGTEFARDGVVLVSFNYRLGNFGLFAFPALSRQSPGGPLGDYFFMDQIAALQWVRRNVASFG